MKNIRYPKDSRKIALADGKGLVTLEIIFPGKSPGKFGARITIQGPADKAECDELETLLCAWIARRPTAANRQTIEQVEAEQIALERSLEIRRLERSMARMDATPPEEIDPEFYQQVLGRLVALREECERVK